MILLIVVLFIKLILLYIISNKFGFVSVHFIILSIFFIYSQSFLIDYLLFGHDVLEYVSLTSLTIHSNEYMYIVFLYLLFFIGYVLISLKVNPRNEILDEKHIYSHNHNFNLFRNFIFISIIFYFTFNIIGLSRLEKISFYSSNQFLFFLINVSLFGSIILIFKNQFSKETNYFVLLFIIINFLFGFLEGGREIFIYTGLSYLFFYEKLNLSIRNIVLFSIVILILPFWKLINVFLFDLNDLDRFIAVLNNLSSVNFKFGLTYLDPLPSLLLINEYLIGNEFFKQFHLSYLLNPTNQFLNIFNLVDSYESISTKITNQFVLKSNFKLTGIAFSGILESILNFWYFGPFILGILLGFISNRIYAYRFKSKFIYKLFSIFFIIMVFKLVRTELAVVLKIYLFPMILSYFIFYYFSFSKLNLVIKKK